MSKTLASSNLERCSAKARNVGHLKLQRGVMLAARGQALALAIEMKRDETS